MASSAKRFYLCNLIPLWEIDEKDMDVDWPRFHAYFGDRIEMRADIKKRKIKWSPDGTTPDPSLKIRFEIHESDYLLSGGLNDYMGSFFSDESFRDDDEARSVLRPIKIVDDVDKVDDADKDRFIFIQWIAAHTTDVEVEAPDGTKTTRHDEVRDTLRVRCWWIVAEEPGGDVWKNPEYYYDVYVEGLLEDGDDFDLHERCDHELEGFTWHVTEHPKRAQVTPIVDGEYAFIKMLQLMDAAQFSIHILNWKMDPSVTLVLEHQLQGDYLQIPGLDEATYKKLLVRCKPLITGVSVVDDIAFYGASNGNLMVALADGSSIVSAIRQYDDPTNVDSVAAVQIVRAVGEDIRVLVLDELRSRLVMLAVVQRGPLLQEAGRNTFALVLGPSGSQRAFAFFEVRPTFPVIMQDPSLVTGIVVIAGTDDIGSRNGGVTPVDPKLPLSVPTGQLNRPRALALHGSTIFIADTGNHSIRHITDFDTASLASSLTSGSLDLQTLAGTTQAGNVDGTGAAARFNQPSGLAFDTHAGRLLVADTGNKLLRAVDPGSGAVTTFTVASVDGVAGASLGEVYGLAFDPAGGAAGRVFVAERDRHRILEIDLGTRAAKTLAGSASNNGHHDGAADDAKFDTPLGLSFDKGKVFVADSENHVVRVIDLATATVSTIGSVDEPMEQDTPVVLHDVLRRKSKEGVSIRVLLDGYGSGFGRDDIAGHNLSHVAGERTALDLRSRGASVQAYKQPHQQSFGERSLGSNHEKMMVVDSMAAVTGGVDFSSDKNDGMLHDRRHRSSLFWHDVVALVEGPAAYDFDKHFERRWTMMRDQWEEKNGPKPDVLNLPDRTDGTLTRDYAESVRTYDRSPLLRVPGGEEVREIRESYRRAIFGAEKYVYLEHQYIYYNELGEYLVEAMRDNTQLQVIWCIPFFTEEARDPVLEHAQWRKAGILAKSITDTKALADPRAQGSTGQIRSQISWHGFYRQHEMVEELRKIDPQRFGIFSIQRPFATKSDLSDLSMEMIYPHSKMLLCDDRFLSIGSANANGRGFTRDGENNVSARSPAAAKAFRDRLWGEHLGYVGVATATAGGLLMPLTGHHLEAGVRVVLRHPKLGPGAIEREVQEVDEATGVVTLAGPTLDSDLGRIMWSDRRFSEVRPGEALRAWRNAVHSLSVYRKVKSIDARTDASGRLLAPGNIAQPGDAVEFGARVALLNKEGESASAEPILQPHIAGTLEVASVTDELITLRSREVELPDREWVAGMAPGEVLARDDMRPFQVKLLSRASGKAKLELSLAPNSEKVNYDYLLSWLVRQPGARQNLRAWEIDPPAGIKYGGPGTVLFSPWLLLPWMFVDFDIDELASLQPADTGTRVV